jgi:hypothetical protein
MMLGMGKVIPIKKKASGRNVSEAERNTVAVKLRLPPEVAATLRDAAGDQGMALSAYVARLLTVMQENPGISCGTLLEDIRGPF